MFLKMSENREMLYSGISYIIGSILFTMASLIDSNSEKQNIESIKQEEQINSSLIMLIAFLIFLVGSALYFDATSQKLQHNKKQLKFDKSLCLSTDIWDFVGSGILLISIIVLVISSQLKVKVVTQR